MFMHIYYRIGIGEITIHTRSYCHQRYVEQRQRCFVENFNLIVDREKHSSYSSTVTHVSFWEEILLTTLSRKRRM